MDEFGKVARYNINRKDQLCVYPLPVNNLEREFKETIFFDNASKRKKKNHLGIH